MPSDARFSDVFVGICFCHPPIPVIPSTGMILTSAPTVYTDCLGQARMSDIVLGFCGHIGMIATGSGSTYTNNLPEARVGDTVVGSIIGNIMTGSPQSFTI